MRFNLRRPCRFYAFTLDGRHWTVVNAGSAVDLNHDARDKLLHALHFPCLIGFFVEFPASAARPVAEFPKRRTRLAVTFHETLVDHRFFHMRASFGSVRADGLASRTPDNGLLRPSPARLAARRESHHFPCELSLLSTRRRGVGLRIGRLELIIQRKVVFTRREIINVRSFFRCGERRRQQIFIFDARVGLLR